MLIEAWPFFHRQVPWREQASYSVDGRVRSRRFQQRQPIIVEMGDSYGLSVEIGSGPYVRRSGRAPHGSASALGSAFFDRPSERIHEANEGECRVLQLKLASAYLEHVLLEDHDRSGEAAIVGSLQGRVDLEFAGLLTRALLLDDERRELAIRAVIARLISVYGERRTAFRSRGMPPSSLRRVRDLVASDPAGVTLQAMADEAGLSLFHFSREFRRETGLTPWNYVVRQRVWTAVRLFAVERRAVEAVAREAGFTHASHMGRGFSKVLGVTPSAIRDRLLP